MTHRNRPPLLVWEVAPDPVRVQLQTIVALEAAGVHAAILPGESVSSPDPILVAGAARQHTRTIGLIPSFSPWVQPPFHTARALGTLDALTGGRAGWFVQTGPAGFVAGDDTPRWNASQVDDPAVLDAALGDYLDAALALWNSWEPGALIADVAAGQYVDPGRVHVTDYHGDYFEVRGPLNMPRSPQGRPPLFARAGARVEADAASSRADVLIVDTEAEVGAARETGAIVLVRLSAPDAGLPPTDADGYLIDGVSALGDGALFGALLYSHLPRYGRPAASLLRERLGLPAAAFEWSSGRPSLTKGLR